MIKINSFFKNDMTLAITKEEITMLGASMANTTMTALRNTVKFTRYCMEFQMNFNFKLKVGFFSCFLSEGPKLIILVPAWSPPRKFA